MISERRVPSCPLPPVSPLLVVLLGCMLLLPFAAQAAPNPHELLDAGRADEALRLLTPQAVGNDAVALNYLCRVFYSLGDWDNAVQNCERAAQLDRQNAIFQLWLGRSYGEKASVSNLLVAYPLARKTVAAFIKAHSLDRHNMAIARDLAEYYASAPFIVGGGSDKALALAAEIAPEYPADAAWVRAMVANNQGHYEQAEHEYNEAIRLDHESAGTYLDLARFFRGRKSWDRFQQTVERAIQSPRIQPSDHYDAAEVLLNAQRNLPWPLNRCVPISRVSAPTNQPRSFALTFCSARSCSKTEMSARLPSNSGLRLFWPVLIALQRSLSAAWKDARAAQRATTEP